MKIAKLKEEQTKDNKGCIEMITLQKSRKVRGYLIVIIMLSHVIDGKFKSISTLLRVIMPSGVAFFLYSTGYGFIKQYLKEGENYLNGFLINKIVKKLLFPYVFACLTFAVLKIAVAGDLNVFRVNRGYTFLPNAWYIDLTIIIYLIYYLIYRYIKKRKQRIAAGIVFSVAFIMGCLAGGYSSVWYGDLPAFILGMIVACCEERLINFFDRYCGIALTTCVCCLAVTNMMTFHLFRFPLSGTLGAFGNAIFTPLVLVLICFKIQAECKYLTWLGDHSYKLYLWHGIVLSAARILWDNVIVIGVVCFLATAWIAGILNGIEKKILCR